MSSSGDRHTLQSALESLKSRGGGTLTLSAGVFLIENVQNAVLCDSCRNISIIGAGAKTILRSTPGTDGADAFFLFRHSDSIYFRNLRLEGLTLLREAWETNQDYHGGIRFMESRDIRIDHFTFLGFFTGAVIIQAVTRGFTVADCIFDSVAYRLIHRGRTPIHPGERPVRVGGESRHGRTLDPVNARGFRQPPMGPPRRPRQERGAGNLRAEHERRQGPGAA
ncbi:MAG: hypothetical protein M3Y08_19480 [Fibrobacterota bacterium]|nr:hypothetical protein [Fibrobacterota bacterium]